MLETKDGINIPLLQIEFDSFLAWQLQAEKHRCIYQLATPYAFIRKDLGTCKKSRCISF